MSVLTLIESLPVESDREIVRIPLNGEKGAGKFAVVDAEDYEKVMAASTAWSIGGGRYAKGNQGHAGPRPLMHRVVMGAPEGVQVDHANGDPLDNRKSNLRVVNNQENARNRGAQVNNTSGYKGVSWNKNAKKWQAGIRAGQSDGRRAKQIYLGLFESKHDAAHAYNLACVKYHGEHAVLNIIQDEAGEVVHTTNTKPEVA